MVAPSGEGAARCMRMALKDVKLPVDYINPHATSTPIGDLKEIEAIREVFGSGEKCPPIPATKSLTGHSQGATGVHEAIYSLLMMNNGFICESANIENLDPGFRRHADRARTPRQRDARLRAVEFFRVRRHQRFHCVQAAGCVSRMLFMAIERFRNRDPGPVYRRFRERGRMMPKGCIIGELDRNEFRSGFSAHGM